MASATIGQLNEASSPRHMLCVKWSNHDNNLLDMFSKLLTAERFVDVTLTCDGRSIKCHKVVLSACSSYLEELLADNTCSHPIIFLKDMKFWEIEALILFMYKGEVNIPQNKLNVLLKAAESLQIRGLGSPVPETSLPNAVIHDPEPEPVPVSTPVLKSATKKRKKDLNSEITTSTGKLAKTPVKGVKISEVKTPARMVKIPEVRIPVKVKKFPDFKPEVGPIEMQLSIPEEDELREEIVETLPETDIVDPLLEVKMEKEFTDDNASPKSQDWVQDQECVAMNEVENREEFVVPAEQLIERMRMAFRKRLAQ